MPQRKAGDDVQAIALSESSCCNAPIDSICPRQVDGGLWHTKNGQEQEIILMQKFINSFCRGGICNVPVTFLRFPRSVKDGAYLLEKLRPILEGISDERFHEVFAKPRK